MDCHGRMLAHILLHESDGIIGMSWNCPSFLVEDSSESDTDSDDYSPPQGEFGVYIWRKKSKNHSSGHIQLVCGAFSNHLVTRETRMVIIIRVTDLSDRLIHCPSQTCE